MNALHQIDLVTACDTETTLGQDWEYIPKLVVSSFAQRSEVDLVHQSEAHAEASAWHVIENESAFANAPFDLAVFMRRWPYMTRPIFDALESGHIHDVLVRAKLLDIARGRYKFNRRKPKKGEKGKGYGLEACCYRSLSVDIEKGEDTWRKKYGLLMDVPVGEWPEDAVRYAENDVEQTLRLFEHQEKRRAEMFSDQEVDVFGDEHRQVRAKWALHLATCWGIRVDQTQIRAYEAQLMEELVASKEILRKAGILRADGTKNIKAAQQLMEEACIAAGFDAPRTSPSKKFPEGQVQLDKEACRDPRIGDGFDPHPVFKAYNDFSGHEKILSTYIGYLKAAGDLPIHPKYDELVDTGRTSCYSPNIQQLPRKSGVRECYVPRPGHVFVLCDFDKAELVALAQICMSQFGWSTLGDALKAGFDPHLKMGADIRGLGHMPYADLVALLASGDKAIKEARQQAKPANFGFPGGMGAPAMQSYAWKNYGVRLTLEQAYELRANWLSSWREMPEYLAWASSLCGAAGIADIQHFMSGRLRGGVGYTEVANGYFQGLCADAAKHALWRVTWHQFCDPSSALYGTHVVAFIHDEIIVEVLEDRANAAAKELERIMIDAYNCWTPDVPVTATAHIEDCWRKN